jgi:hypothetical protein
MYGSTFLTSALRGSEWSPSRPGSFTRGKEPPLPLNRRLGRPPEPVFRELKNLLPLPEMEPRIVQPVVLYTIPTPPSVLNLGIR